MPGAKGSIRGTVAEKLTSGVSPVRVPLAETVTPSGASASSVPCQMPSGVCVASTASSTGPSSRGSMRVPSSIFACRLAPERSPPR